MSEKNEFEIIFGDKNNLEDKIINNEEESPKLPEQIKKQIFITAEFGTGITEIGYMFLATGEQNIVTVSNGRINLLQGRMYYIPITDQMVDSDNYNIKVSSNVADRVDVRFVKDGFACVVPIRHNAVLKNNERLCVLIPF